MNLFEIQRQHAAMKAHEQPSAVCKAELAAANGPSEEDVLLSSAEVARQIGVTENGLAKMRCTGDGPRFVKIGARVRYRRSAVRAFVAERERASTSAAPP